MGWRLAIGLLVVAALVVSVDGCRASQPDAAPPPSATRVAPAPHPLDAPLRRVEAALQIVGGIALAPGPRTEADAMALSAAVARFGAARAELVSASPDGPVARSVRRDALILMNATIGDLGVAEELVRVRAAGRLRVVGLRIQPVIPQVEDLRTRLAAAGGES
jgi:hypothetical protein